MMSSSSRRITNSDLLESSSTTVSAEIAQDIIEDVSGDDGSTSNGQTNNKDDGPTNADDDDRQQSKLTEFHAKNYFNSTMGGKDLRVLFAMVIGCNSMDLPDHKEPLFSRSKTYHSEISYGVGNKKFGQDRYKKGIIGKSCSKKENGFRSETERTCRNNPFN